MSPNGRLWLVAIGAAVVGALLGAGAVWATQQPAIASLNARIVTIEAERDASLLKVEDLTTAIADLKATASTTVTETSSITPTPTAPPKKPVSKTTKQFTFITKIIESGATPVIVADYAQMLSGDAAAAAATAHGDESPPPNDYYIVNDNKLLRKLKVQPGIKVTVVTNADGTSDPTGHTVSFADWAANYSAPTADNESLRTAPYWITVKNGVVTKIEQQYLP